MIGMYVEMTEKRRYTMGIRGEQLEATRRQIIEATVELHRTVGPAGTQISEIARRAGVQRVTIYNHFPDDALLLAACSAHWRTLHPTPDLTAWRAVAEPSRRLRLGLGELYAWYRETEPMTANVLRDAETVPALGPIIERGLGAYLEAARRVLSDDFQAGGRLPDRLQAAVRVAVDFHAWRALAGLGDPEAADLAASFVELAANT